jgi:RluA family pseudouridine synthase
MSRINPGRILYEDQHLLVVNKLDGELVVTAGGHGKLPLFDFLKKSYAGLRVVHRLDFGTSGVIVFAKTAEAARKIRESKFGGWAKRYRALAAGHMNTKQGVIERKLPARTKDMLVPALSRYAVLETFPLASYVEVEIDTGRKHQIRQHLKFIGHPLLLDPLYGNEKADQLFRKKFHYQRFFLHAFSLDFIHPITRERLHIEAPISPSFEKVLRELRTHA